MTNFNIFGYATIADAVATIFHGGKAYNNITLARPSFENPRPCFGFIWTAFNNEVRTSSKYIVDYRSNIYINCNPNWANRNNKKNYCALHDDEIDIYLKFVSEIAGEKFVITRKPFKEDYNGENAFKGLIVNVDAKQVPFKHVMIICNLIRYMYEWPESYNLKQMMAAYKKQLFFEDFGQIFCLYESFMRNNYDQKVSFCNSGSDPSYIDILNTEQLAQKLQNFDINLNAANFLEFKYFNKIIDTLAKSRNLWGNNKAKEYMSDNYLKREETELDDIIIKPITQLYKLVLMDESINNETNK